MSPSTEGEWERVRDSTQPVHSWNDSHTTEGRFAFSSAAANAGTAPGGRAIIEAVAAQNLRKPRRLMPWALRLSPRLIFDVICGSPGLNL